MSKTMYESVKMDRDLPMKVLHFSNENPLFSSYLEEEIQQTNLLHYVPMHWHRSIEFTYVIKGELTLRTNDSEKKYQDGDIFIINSGEIHEIKGMLSDEFELICFIISYDFIKKHLPNIDQMYFDMAKTKESYAEFTTLFSTILATYQEAESFSNLKIQSELLQLLYLLCRYHLLEKDHLQTINHSNKELNQEILNYVQEHYADNLSLEEISLHFNFSREHFSRLFKSIFGHNFSQYLSEYRLYQAFPDIVEGKDTIEMISLRYGFPSAKALINQFKKVYHETPARFRKKYAVEMIQNTKESFKGI